MFVGLDRVLAFLCRLVFVVSELVVVNALRKMPCIKPAVCKDTIILKIIFISMLMMIIVIAIIAQVFRDKDYISTKMYKALLVCTTATIL